ncbi:hypothetical protein LSH36_261g03049 [Paralvinella palmiformis]|uniref:Wiskott-Aldrich syndrome protein family member n=1 Tax=Paralvinella palmiformis TaxID=53620 RepID=A0AAD9JK41_9ANNE|nr:hypothetical protein LSH36_261g03049 [Paralvinella palmiformis]
MPLIKRGIEPVNLSRTHVGPGVQNELECVTNSTLANVIRQLSSLSKHAEDMFSELTQEANNFFHRANQIQERVDRLKIKVTQLDSTGEEVSLQDIHMRKPYKSSTKKDQQIITLATRPEAISEIYALCDAPPPLDKLNPYREDGKDSRKFYTDPTYFFELWCREMQNNTELTKKELHKRKNKKLYHVHQAALVNGGQRPKGRQPQMIREAKNRVQDMQKYKDGMEFVPRQSEINRRANNVQGGQRSPSRPNSLEIRNQNQYTADVPTENGQLPGYDSQYSHQDTAPYGQVHNDTQVMANQAMNQAWNDGHCPVDQVPQYHEPPPYNHNHNLEDYKPVSEPVQFNNNIKHYNPEVTTPQGTTTKPAAGRLPALVTSPRPSAPPPAPPGMQNKLDSPMGASRESLPPPPPPPPPDSSQMEGVPAFGPSSHLNSLRDSPAHHSPSPQLGGKSTTPDSIDIPPPPPPPPLMNTPDTPSSINSMPPPPPTPPALESQPLSTAKPLHDDMVSVPPPPPPPPDGLITIHSKMPNGDLPHSPKLAVNSNLSVSRQVDAVSMASNASSNTISSSSTLKSEDTVAPVRDTRCDLLAAIREGIKLRKVEERRYKEEQKKLPSASIDVQSIMEAAFEMRRKALEANDDEDDEDDDDDDDANGEWSDGS